MTPVMARCSTVRPLLLSLVRSLVCIALSVCSALHSFAAEQNSEFVLSEAILPLKQIDLSPGLRKDSFGYPRIDPRQIDLTKIVERPHKSVIMENRYIRIVVLPEMGRVFSLFDKISGHEQLWTNQVARPLFHQKNDLQWWMVWGGVEYTIPNGEHGTTWALPWRYEIVENSDERKAVRMQVLEPKTQLEQTVEISINSSAASFQSDVSVRNASANTVRFSHWVNPMWAPGGRGELTAKTEFIVPTDRMIVADRDFNRWMLGDRIQPWRDNPLRFAENWRDIGDLLALKLDQGFYSAFCHEANEGVARVFDRHANPGMDIWTWGFPPPPQRQKEYSPTPNRGYVEMWGGTVRDFTDEALKPIAPGETVRFVEWMFPYRGTKGLTTATRDLAVNFVLPRSEADEASLAICAIRPIGDVVLNVADANGHSIWRRTVQLAPESPFHAQIPVRNESEQRFTFEATTGTNLLLRTHAVPPTEIRWGAPYMSK